MQQFGYVGLVKFELEVEVHWSTGQPIDRRQEAYLVLVDVQLDLLCVVGYMCAFVHVACFVWNDQSCKGGKNWNWEKICMGRSDLVKNRQSGSAKTIAIGAPLDGGDVTGERERSLSDTPSVRLFPTSPSVWKLQRWSSGGTIKGWLSQGHLSWRSRNKFEGIQRNYDKMVIYDCFKLSEFFCRLLTVCGRGVTMCRGHERINI